MSARRAARDGWMPEDHDPDGGDRPDVEIGARVKAKRLRFKSKPQTDVRVHAEPDGETTWGSERNTLPDEVEAGKTSRDVGVRGGAAERIAGARQQRH